MSKNLGFFIFFGNSTISFFDFLHDDRGQHRARSGQGGFLNQDSLAGRLQIFKRLLKHLYLNMPTYQFGS